MGKRNNNLFLLLGICLIVFVLFAFVKAIWYFNYPDKLVAQALFYKNVMGLFTLPADTTQLAQKP